MLVDSHAHLDLFDSLKSIGEVLARAKQKNVGKVITIGDSLESSREAIRISHHFREVFAAVGVHPHNAAKVTPDFLEQLRELTADEKVIAIGEIGLDYYYKHSAKDIQKRIFLKQLTLAKSLKLPVIIHNREAHQELLNILVASGVTKGVWHCFSGDEENLVQAIKLGFYISFSGIVTFKNASQIQRVATKTPLNRLLIETDAPYLAPHPYRGKRNEPSFLPLIAQKIAELKGISLESLVSQMEKNLSALFGI
jgi:TatD DNase family protein